MNDAKIEKDIEYYSLDVARETSVFRQIKADSLKELLVNFKIWKNYAEKEAEKEAQKTSEGKTGVKMKHTILAFRNFSDGEAQDISQELEALDLGDEYIF
jgi:AMMECR1 domain-containing protein